MDGDEVRVLLADDEPVALERLQLALSCIPDAQLVAAAKNGREAVALIRELKPDAAVLDIQMPILDGFGVIESIKADDYVPEIVFVTAFDSHAIRAFDVQAVDYLLKPVSFERLREALRRVKGRLEVRASDERFAELQRVLQAIHRGNSETTVVQPCEIWVHERRGLTKVVAAAIDRIEAEGDYIRLHVASASYLVKGTISGMQVKLDPTAFARVHRSTIVNLARVKSVRRRLPRGLLLVLNGGSVVTVGPRYAADVMKRIQANRWRAS